MIYTVHHYRARRGIKLLDMHVPDWRNAMEGVPEEHVESVLHAIRDYMPYPYRLQPKTGRQVEMLRYFGFHETDPKAWLHWKDKHIPNEILPMTPPRPAHPSHQPIQFR